jgi:hypothetical protein
MTDIEKEPTLTDLNTRVTVLEHDETLRRPECKDRHKCIDEAVIQAQSWKDTKRFFIGSLITLVILAGGALGAGIKLQMEVSSLGTDVNKLQAYLMRTDTKPVGAPVGTPVASPEKTPWSRTRIPTRIPAK